MREQLTEAEQAAAKQKARARAAERRAETAAREAERAAELRARWLVHHAARERAQDKIVIEVIRKLRPDMEMAFICGDARWFESMIRKCKGDAASDAGPRGPRWEDVPSGAEYSAYLETYLPAFEKEFTRWLAYALKKHDRDMAKKLAAP
jgi:hypothetical protein